MKEVWGHRVALSLTSKMSEKTYGKYNGAFPHPNYGNQKDWPCKCSGRLSVFLDMRSLSLSGNIYNGDVWQVAGEKMNIRTRENGTRPSNLVVTHIEVMSET